ncbi:unnamed protein product [Peronospora farinosa]|uniref:J domain-containing protein n=1 Tax=Peronospora farinosa TaxID=134698 RepID=A0AAV0U2F5_9STRA|nr:unnamed protein product [Peronospora farinosa]CAI5730558.1 unnamed protein product [Peronospora farinosa]
MRRTTVGVGAKDISLLPNARALSGGSSRGRNGGLFSSSSSSSGDSDVSDEENDTNQSVSSVPFLSGATDRSHSSSTHSNSLPVADVRRRTMFSTASTALCSSATMEDNAGHLVERKGLFEKDDDVGDTLETLHKRVKLRQSKKQSEMKAMQAQLETADQRAEELERRLSQANKDKEEFSIRTKECQRIIEKRNKQLMKASERMARHADQYEFQMAQLQARLTNVTAQCDHLRAEAATVKENVTKEWELKEKELRNEMETRNTKHEKLIHAAEASLCEQQAENAVLAKKLREVKQQLTTTGDRKPSAVQVMVSEEYQSLVKRCEDSEAISRELKCQLEKEHQKNKCLFKQLTALQETLGTTTATSAGFFPDTSSSEPKDDSGNLKDRVTTVVAEAELASFDFTAGKRSYMSSPVETEVGVDSVVDVSPTCEASRSSQSRSRGLSASSFTDDALKPSLREGKRRAASAQTIKTVVEPPDKLGEDKAGNGKLTVTSVTFFEKLSSRFKRCSSPGNGLNIYKAEDNGMDGATSSEIECALPIPSRQGFTHSKVLKERPRMYVAKPASDHEDESSDSIFGSESSSSDLSDDDSPPPPPPMYVHRALPLFIPTAHMDISSQVRSSDISADADFSSSSDDDFEVHEEHKAAEKMIQLPKIADLLEPREQTESLRALQTPPGIALPSTSSSSASDDDPDEPDVEKSQPLHVDIKKAESLSESSSMSSSSGDDIDQVVHTSKTKVHQTARKESLTGQDYHGKRASGSPTLSKCREKNRSLSGGDNLHKTSKSRMNEYMEVRAKKRNEKIKRTQQKEQEDTIKKEEYEKEWEKMAQEERERKRKQQQARRNGRRRPTSTKTVRVSQMRQQINNKLQQMDHKETPVPPPLHPSDLPRPHHDDGVDVDGRRSRRKSESKTSESEVEEERPLPSIDSPPLPPEPTMADTELYLRQQARLRERHELQMKKKVEADEADAVRGDIHRRVEMWAFGKKFLHMILTLDQISSNDALKKCQLMVAQSPDDDTVRKAYRNILRVVHPDKLRGATIPEQLVAKELFTALNQAFEKSKNQVA